STSMTPQSMSSVSPVARYPVRFAEGVVMPSPELRPVAADRGQAIVAMMPMTTAVAKGFHRFSVSRWASPRFLGGSAAIGVLSLMDCQPDGDGRDEDDEDPRAQLRARLQAAVVESDRADALGEAGGRAQLHERREQGVEDQCEPAAHESLTGPVVRAGGAAAGQDHRGAEDQPADDRGQPRERLRFASDE